ncbi:MAG TPA: DUF488 family protein [Azospirillum sp.]
MKRVYDPPSPDDGQRILVDRLWPRGLRKEDARLDAWLRDIAPSPELRKWYGHEEAKWPEFQARYKAELAANAGALDELRRRLKEGPVTLLHASGEGKHSHAEILAEILRNTEA